MKIKSLILLSMAAILFSGCREREYKETRLLLDTVCEITAVDSHKAAEVAIEAAFGEIARIDKLCGYDKDSEVSRINANAGIAPVKTERELYDLIEESVRMGGLTGGAFDITVGPLISLWGFDTVKPALPSGKEIKRVLPLVNYKNIVLDRGKSTVFLAKQGMKIDLGGIAKKYAMRMAMKKLSEKGIKKALINLGGDVQVKGGAPGGRPWRVGVKHPRKQNEFITVLQYKDKTIVTSGDYERYFIKDGRRYCHIFDPHTGYPADKGVISSTVITDGAISADVLATAIVTIGAEKGLALIKKIPGTEALIINETNKGADIILSDGLKKSGLSLTY